MSRDLDARVVDLERALAVNQEAITGLAARVRLLESSHPMASGAQPSPATAQGARPTRPSGKYSVLTDWLDTQSVSMIPSTFAEIEGILGFDLPESAYNYQPYWQGLPNPLARAVLAAGWKVTSLSLTSRTLVLQKTGV